MTRELILLALLYTSGTYSFQQGYRFTSLRMRTLLDSPSILATQSSCATLQMSTAAETAEAIPKESSAPKPKVPKTPKSAKPYVDYSAFSIGQEHTGIISNVQPFGVFVHIEAGCDVLLPRSQLTKTQFDKLSSQFEAKSQEGVKVSLIGKLQTINHALGMVLIVLLCWYCC
ncbi:S1 RNA-binding domain-containing protein [archaeon]|nr:MAG: S1 RNA-binding domain-containing protein [archaeon]